MYHRKMRNQLLLILPFLIFICSGLGGVLFSHGRSALDGQLAPLNKAAAKKKAHLIKWGQVEQQAARMRAFSVTRNEEAAAEQVEERAKVAANGEDKADEDKPELTDLQGDTLPRGAIARLGTVRLRPLSDNYYYIVFSPDGKTLAVDGGSGLCLWEAATGKRAGWFHDTFAALAACFSPDGKTLIACDKSGTLRRWQVGSGKLLQEIQQAPDPNLLGISGFFSADGTTYGVASYRIAEQVIRLWDVATGKQILRWEPKVNHYPEAALSPDGKLPAAGGERNLVHLIDTATGKEVWCVEGPNKPPNKLAAWSRSDPVAGVRRFVFLQDGRLLSGVVHDAVCFWDVATSKLRYRIKTSLGRVAFSPDGKYVVRLTEEGLSVFEVPSGKAIRHLEPSSYSYGPAAFSPDGKTLAALGGGTIRLWDLATGKPRQDYPGHVHGVNCLAFSPDGATLASGDAGKFGEEGTVLVWDLASRRPRHSFPGHAYGVTCLAYSLDGKLLASGEGDAGSRPELEAKIRLWDVRRGRLRREFFAHRDRVQSLAFSPNGKMLASAGHDHCVKLWDVGSGERLRQIRSEEDHFKSVAFSADGKLLILTYVSGGMSAWRVDSFQRVRDFEMPRIDSRMISPSVNNLLSPDGKTLATVGGDLQAPSIQLWDTDTRKPPIRLHGHTGGAITVLAFSPDSCILASGGKDTTLLLWDVRRARLRH